MFSRHVFVAPLPRTPVCKNKTSGGSACGLWRDSSIENTFYRNNILHRTPSIPQETAHGVLGKNLLRLHAPPAKTVLAASTPRPPHLPRGRGAQHGCDPRWPCASSRAPGSAGTRVCAHMRACERARRWCIFVCLSCLLRRRRSCTAHRAVRLDARGQRDQREILRLDPLLQRVHSLKGESHAKRCFEFCTN